MRSLDVDDSKSRRLHVGYPVALIGTAAVGAFAWGSASWRAECPSRADCVGLLEQLVMSAVMVIFACVLSLLAIVAVRIGLSRAGQVARVRPSSAVVAVALAVATLLATPVSSAWYDGCNYHSGRLPLASAALVAGFSPGFVPGYVGTSTRVNCD